MKTSPFLTQKKKSRLLNEHVFYEIIFALGVSKHDAFDYCVWEHLNHSRMGHARALIYFFEKSNVKGLNNSKMWPDDLVSEDFGFPPKPIKLSKRDRNRLNKDLFHLSSKRLHHTAKSKPWPNTFLNRVRERTVKFIRHILSAKLERGVIILEPQWKALLNFLESGHELLISSPSGSPWILDRGRRLGSGLSELTSWSVK
jgi:hypothetical protein